MTEYLIRIYTDNGERSLLVKEENGIIQVHKHGLYIFFGWVVGRKIKKIVVEKCEGSICTDTLHRWEEH